MRFFTFRTAALALAAMLGATGLRAELRVQQPFIIFIGPPGSGKSTQAEALSKSRSIPVLSAEQMIQENQALLAASRNPKISGMELRSDPPLNRIFGAYLAKSAYSKGLILDGYPSTKDHCDYLAKLFTEGTVPAALVLQLDLDDETVRKRMKSQDNASLEQRIKDYHREMDMIHLYFPKAEFVKIDASRKAGAVTKEINQALAARLSVKK